MPDHDPAHRPARDAAHEPASDSAHDSASEPAAGPANRPAIPGLDVGDVVARGGHGTVYRAHQRAHDRTVALKVLDAQFADDAMRRRFDRERTALGRISDHPGIVGLLDSGYTESGAPYLLLEFAAGGTLADRLADGALGVDEATSVVVGLAAALERIHAAGIVHNDIKPANIMRSAYGTWMLTDFGIASLVDRSATSVVHVSYAHTAPETFDGHSVGPLADVYALASVLASCLTATEPFAVGPAEAPVSAMRRIATEPYPDLRPFGVPDALAALIEVALSKDPNQRPVSARAFASALNAVRTMHGLDPVPIVVGPDVAPDATVAVTSSELEAVGFAGGRRRADGVTPPPSAGSDPSDSDRRDGRSRRLLTLAAVVAAAATAAGVVLPTTADDPVLDAAEIDAHADGGLDVSVNGDAGDPVEARAGLGDDLGDDDLAADRENIESAGIEDAGIDDVVDGPVIGDAVDDQLAAPADSGLDGDLGYDDESEDLPNTADPTEQIVLTAAIDVGAPDPAPDGSGDDGPGRRARNGPDGGDGDGDGDGDRDGRRGPGNGRDGDRQGGGGPRGGGN